MVQLNELPPPPSPPADDNPPADVREQRLFRIMELDPTHLNQMLHDPHELALDRFMETAPTLTRGHQDVVTFKLKEDTAISCIQWKNRWFITGTDIVRLLVYRFEVYTGRQPLSMKKFEEGIFSDLRRLSPPHDCILESTRSDFLVFLFDYDCVRSKKKQKVFFWQSFHRIAQNIFCDAMERELARIQMANAVGLSVDEFIKSGIVPTGTSAQHDPAKFNLGFDWTQVAEKRMLNEDLSYSAFLQIDHIHIIRNDVNIFFSKFLRAPLTERKHLVFDEPPVQEAFDSRMGRGQFTPPKKPSENTSDNHFDSNEENSMVELDSGRTSRQSSTVSRSRKRSPLVTQATTRGNYRTSPLRRSTPQPGGRQSSKLNYEAFARMSEGGGLFRRQDDDELSVSTLSSNDDQEFAWVKGRKFMGERELRGKAMRPLIQEDELYYAYPAPPFGIPVPCPFHHPEEEGINKEFSMLGVYEAAHILHGIATKTNE